MNTDNFKNLVIDCMLNTDRLVGQSLDTFTVRIEFFLNNQIFKGICFHSDESPACELYLWNDGAQKYCAPSIESPAISCPTTKQFAGREEPGKALSTA